MTRGAPLVSVVLPVHNGERFLGEAIQSVLDQTYGPIELIVVDDGSPDRCAAIARSYSQVRLVEQANQGVGAARNAGVAAAHGDFLAFIDQDDIWLPEKIHAQIRMLDDDSIDYCLVHEQRFLEPSEVLPVWMKPELLSTPLLTFDPSVMLVRRRTLARVGLFNPAFVQASDADWCFRASELGMKYAVAPGTLVRRRIHTHNNSRFVSRNKAELRRIAYASMKRRRETENR
jgi:glycosyltransferase involved in cell wall biosynthesis